MKNNRTYPPLVAIFPNSFKIVGTILIALSLGIMVYVREMHVFEANSQNMALAKLITRQCALLGMSFIVFSKAKMEDERTNQIRLYLFFIAFYFGLAKALLIPVINYLIPNEPSEFSAIDVFFEMMLLIIILPFVLKLFKRKGDDQ